jgi:hypothetical protein
VLLPLVLALAVAALLLAARWRPEPRRSDGGARGSRLLPVVALGALAVLGVWIANHTGPDAHRSTVSSRGPVSLAGSAGVEATAGLQGAMRMTAEKRNSRRTPLPPRDRVDIEAQVRMADGTVHAIRATQPMVREPQGRFTTRNGVGFDVWHHGRSGSGSLPRAPVHSEVAAFASGSLSTNGRVVATGVPVHVMTDTAAGAIELHAGDAATPLPGVPGGHLQPAWAGYDGGDSRRLTNARYAWGSGVLIMLLAFAVAAARRQRAQPRCQRAGVASAGAAGRAAPRDRRRSADATPMTSGAVGWSIPDGARAHGLVRIHRPARPVRRSANARA